MNFRNVSIATVDNKPYNSSKAPMHYEKVFKVFQRLKVKYLIGGGLAVNLYGVPRFTKDIDILIDISPKNLERLQKALKVLGYKQRMPIPAQDFFNPKNWQKWKRQKGLIALNLYCPKKPYQEIDLLVNAPMSYKEAKKHAVSIRSGSLKIHLVGLADLIKMKKNAGRGQDKSDVLALKKIKRLRG